MASIKETIHTFTPSGRYEQYRAKHDYLLDQAQGEVRYGLEKRIDHDAKVYARNAVALEIIGTAAVVSGAYFLGREIHRGKLESDIRAIGKAVHDIPKRVEDAKQIPGRLYMAWQMFLIQSGQQAGTSFGNGLVESLKAGVPADLTGVLHSEAGSLGEAFATGAVMGIQNGLGAAVDGKKASVAISATEAQLKVFTWLTNLLGGNKS